MRIDDNGVDTGALYRVHVGGQSGTIQVSSLAHLYPSFLHQVRIIPVNGDRAVGEASDVSSVTMDGVYPVDGGNVGSGFGLNVAGSDGFLTSNNYAGTDSVEVFDQKTKLVTSVPATGDASQSVFGTASGGGAYPTDIALYSLLNLTSSTFDYQVLNPMANGTIASGWTPPTFPSGESILESAIDPVDGDPAFITFAEGPAPSFDGVAHLFTSKILANTIGPVYDVSGPVASQQAGQYTGLAENPLTHKALLVTGPESYASCSQVAGPTLVTVPLAGPSAGKVSSFAGLGKGPPLGVAIDYVTNKAAVTQQCDAGLSIYDLATNAGNEISLPAVPGAHDGQSSGSWVAADPLHHLFSVSQGIAPDLFFNNNGLSEVDVYDENGGLRARQNRFNFFGQFVQIASNPLQMSPMLRTGFTLGPLGQSLEPFNY
ncbi:MAG: hypothetical protein GIX03_02390 [Candidatus Eremiobacteraeota bacterium]|nr:hypothetical protein [Candidatus Eremiobacteraeota bacterium]MBC5805706.1 hypothetical protein [Candidatus Eremiobacteraeota bacterium]MBC5824667.1 hypothetical protein [Candidatus Eremiobacteraeota bacterium]